MFVRPNLQLSIIVSLIYMALVAEPVLTDPSLLSALTCP